MSVATAERWCLPMIGASSPCPASTPSAVAATASTDVASSAERGPGTIAVHSCPRARTGRKRTIRMSAYASLDSTYFGTREAAIRARVSSTRAT